MLRIHLHNVHISFVQGIETASCINAFAKNKEFHPVGISRWVYADAAKIRPELCPPRHLPCGERSSIAHGIEG
ncbi:hypothetical protein BY998_12066 [Methylobacterium sp. B4]|nr:hypothetical protein BY998_12066 [Methylobacterium sp. B4]